jgi:hypothetical protein
VTLYQLKVMLELEEEDNRVVRSPVDTHPADRSC